jgi:hypothetical protein
VNWFFDGIGTEIISILVSLVVGGAVGYTVGVKRTVKQMQTAGENARQRQETRLGEENVGAAPSKRKAHIRQSQKAGDGAVQTQIGGIDHDRQ